MTKFCESCHTANRDRARYCQGCAGRFTGIRTAANVSPEPMTATAGMPAAVANDLLVVSRTTEKREFARQPVLPGGLDAPVVLLLMAVFLSIAGFVFWYWNRTVERSPAPAREAAAIHWRQAELPAASLPEPVDSRPAAAPVAVAPIVEQHVEPATSLQEPAPETPAVAPAPAELQVAASEEQAPPAEQPFNAPQAEASRIPDSPPPQAPTRQGLAEPPRARAGTLQRHRSTATTVSAPRAVTVSRQEAMEPVITDVRRSIQTEQPRIDSPAPVVRPTAPVQVGTVRRVGGTTRCDRYNPFGETICVSAPVQGAQAANSSAAAASGASIGGGAVSKGTISVGGFAIANSTADPGGSSPSTGNGSGGGAGVGGASGAYAWIIVAILVIWNKKILFWTKITLEIDEAASTLKLTGDSLNFR